MPKTIEFTDEELGVLYDMVDAWIENNEEYAEGVAQYHDSPEVVKVIQDQLVIAAEIQKKLV